MKNKTKWLHLELEIAGLEKMAAKPQSTENQQNLIYNCGVNAEDEEGSLGSFSGQHPKCEFKKTFGRSDLT